MIRDVAKKVFSEMGSSLSYKVGTMIEIPRAALVADEVGQDELSLQGLCNLFLASVICSLSLFLIKSFDLTDMR